MSMRPSAKKNSYMRNDSLLKAVECLGIAVLLMLLCSCASFNIGDWPSNFTYPHNAPPANLCGSIGAFCGYYLLYYIGPGVFITLATAICFLGTKIAQKPIDQPVLRTIGLGLLTVAASITIQCLWPEWRLYFPSGGVLGSGVAKLLQSYFASVGTFILTMAIWIVGAILLADSLIVMIVRGLGFAAGKRQRKLAIRPLGRFRRFPGRKTLPFRLLQPGEQDPLHLEYPIPGEPEPVKRRSMASKIPV